MSVLSELKSDRRGLMVVLSSPSGAGKTTLTRKLLADNPGMAMSVSATTRPPRIFILPPNMRELEQRLRTRAQDSEAVIAKRMSKSEAEISHWAEYDYVIVNEDVSTALAELQTIVNSERMRRRRQMWLGGFVKTLVNGG